MRRTPVRRMLGRAMYPFERFAAGAQRVLTLAEKEAERAHHSYIGTEHVVLGLMRAESGIAFEVLSGLGITIERLHVAIEAILGRNEGPLPPRVVPTPRVKEVIRISLLEAHRMGDDHADTEHLLLGLLVEGEGIAAHVLGELGAILERVTPEIERLRHLARNASGGDVAAGPALERIMARARDEARSTASAEIAPEHVLVALLDDDDAAVSRVLDAVGVDRDRLRRVLRPPRRLVDLRREMSHVHTARERAARDQDYEGAAVLRDRERELITECAVVEIEWRDVQATSSDDRPAATDRLPEEGGAPPG